MTPRTIPAPGVPGPTLRDEPYYVAGAVWYRSGYSLDKANNETPHLREERLFIQGWHDAKKARGEK